MLSLADLLVARDLYHLHLTAKQHVIGTAIGRYLIRESERWPKRKRDLTALDIDAAKRRRKSPRTLANSEVRPYSWPCVLMFVDTWIDVADVMGGHEAEGDTRLAPVQERTPETVTPAHYPTQLVGGGYPIVIESQQATHVASVGCLVTDGHSVYGLTDRRVVGDAGEPIHTLMAGDKVRVAESAGRQLTRKPFEEVYGG